MKRFISAWSLAWLLASSVATAQHPGISTSHRDGMQRVMAKHIQELTESNGNGKYPIFDPDTRSIVQLEFKGLHDSVEVMGRKTPYFVSCADFVASDGTLFDVDFFISERYEVVIALVHAKNETKTDYDVH